MLQTQGLHYYHRDITELGRCVHATPHPTPAGHIIWAAARQKQQYAQADLSLCWAHRSFCWFCHAAAHFKIVQFSSESERMEPYFALDSNIVKMVCVAQIFFFIPDF